MELDEAKREATAAVARGDAATALSAAGRAVQLDRDDFDALLLLGVAQLEMGQAEYALPPLRRASSLRPDDPHCAFVLAQALTCCGQSAEARVMLKRAAALAVAEGGASTLVERVGQ